MTSVTSSHWTLGSFSQRKQAWPCLPGFVWSRRCRTDCKRKGEKRASLQTFSLSVSSKFPELEKVISGFLIEFCDFLFMSCCRVHAVVMVSNVVSLRQSSRLTALCVRASVCGGR